MVHAVIYEPRRRLASLRPRAGHAAMCSGVFLGLGRATELLSAMPPASCPFVSMTRAVSLQWTARCAPRATASRSLNHCAIKMQLVSAEWKALPGLS